MKDLTLFGVLVLTAACAPTNGETAPQADNDAPIPYVTGSTYTCDPASFKLTQTSLLDTGAQYELTGRLDMPTPGYSYSFTPQPSLTADHHVYTLQFTKPDGMAVQMIDTLEISHRFNAVPYLQDVQVMLKNQANWHPKTISCQVQDR